MLSYMIVPVLFFLTSPFIQTTHGAKELNYVYDPPNEIELLMVVDNEAYSRWYQREGGDHGAGRQMRTQQAITKYVTSVVHGMNSIFKTLESQDVRVHISLVDILIIQTEEGGTWLSSLSKAGFPRNIVKATKALEAFNDWVWKHKSLLPAHDHAMLLTGFDLQSKHETPGRLTTGHAYLGTMCREASVSVVENQFNFEDVEAASHELGHSLGSEHDGEGNVCTDKDGYLMAPIIKVNATYRWFFSSCSVDYIQELIDQLASEGKNCLYHKNNVGHMPIQPNADVQLGELLTPDQQCVLIEGPGSFLCRDFYGANDYPTLCRNMWCHNVTSRTQNKQTCNTFLGSDGFVCGNQKRCVQGECVVDSSAPDVLDHCPHGDEQGIIWKNLTCADIIELTPEQCYDPVTQKKCCASCDKIDTGDLQCPFGDKSSWCRTHLEIPVGCYNNEDLCCGTCAKLKQTAKPECAYGDRSTWCNTTLQVPMGCYDNEQLCCETCKKHKIQSNPECPYGDKSSWCSTKLTVPYDCYKNSELCCSTCAKHYKPQTRGCEYGDKSTWCAKEMKAPSGCYLNSELCCGTCSQYYNSSDVGCEYGDKHSDCSKVDFPMGCYKNQLLCCGSCRPLKRPDRRGCEFGDKSLWCKNRLRPVQDCPLNMDLCCGTCQYKDAKNG
ncbi:hypothetical protein SNE40_023152 [Patella caerulea]|uniref:Peptidase M12B domain-containing protein n=1 Tax=Patella caerulea TaxID=87958 RepID=A0AAN8G6Q5_PATCE